MQINLIDRQRKDYAKSIIDNSPNDHVCIVKKRTRSLDQSALMHALFADVARQHPFNGKMLTPAQWKVLFISGHAIATGLGAEVVPGLEGEFCNIRESSAHMTVARMNSLIEYIYAYGADHDIKWSYKDE